MTELDLLNDFQLMCMFWLQTIYLTKDGTLRSRFAPERRRYEASSSGVEVAHVRTKVEEIQQAMRRVKPDARMAQEQVNSASSVPSTTKTIPDMKDPELSCKTNKDKHIISRILASHMGDHACLAKRFHLRRHHQSVLRSFVRVLRS